MQSDDKPVNGQQPNTPNPPSFLDLMKQLPLPGAKDAPRTARFSRLRTTWQEAWEEGGFLYQRWEDLYRAPGLGWHSMANWVKTTLGLAAACALLILLDGAAGVLADAVHRLFTAVPRVQVGADTSTGVFAVLDQPIRSYIAAHSTTLPVNAATVYTLWQAVGLFGLIGGFLRSSGARLTWTAWGAATIAMVHSITPADGRTIATALAVLAWTTASTLALRGLTLRPHVSTHIHNAGHHIAPQIHLPSSTAPPADESPANVSPLQQR
ncbi:hypothetical protein ACH4MN_36390 [Streptomyces anulatus]